MWKTFCQLPVLLRIGGGALALGMAAFIGAYALALRGNRVSSNPADWGNLGSYLGGTIGPLLSLVAVGAMYATYFQQQSYIEQQVNAARDSALSGLIGALTQAVESCQREDRKGRTLGGHAYFEGYGSQLWSDYCDCYNKGMDNPWETARANLLLNNEANWVHIRGQLEYLLRFIDSTMTGTQRVEAMRRLQSHLTQGIATLLAVDTYLNKMSHVTAMAEEFGLLRSVPPEVRD